HIIIATVQTIERIQAADCRMPLQNANTQPELGQTDSSRQTRHTGADDQSIVHGAKNEGVEWTKERTRTKKSACKAIGRPAPTLVVDRFLRRTEYWVRFVR